MILGIDIGVSGAIAWLDDTGACAAVSDMPVVAGIASPHGLVQHLTTMLRDHARPRHAYVERAQAMPRQGVVSMFTYGQSFGTVLGVLASYEIPYTLVSPSQWKRAFGLIGRDKDAARALAQQWFPAAPLARKRDHGRAEALLIARWGLLQRVRATPDDTRRERP